MHTQSNYIHLLPEAYSVVRGNRGIVVNLDQAGLVRKADVQRLLSARDLIQKQDFVREEDRPVYDEIIDVLLSDRPRADVDDLVAHANRLIIYD